MKLKRVIEIDSVEMDGIKYEARFFSDEPWVIGLPGLENPYSPTGWSKHSMSFRSPAFQTYELAEDWIEELTKRVVAEAKKMLSVPEKLKTLQGKKTIEIELGRVIS